MLRIHFTAADFARVRFASRPAPLQELHVVLGTMCRPDDALLFGAWRQRLLRTLPNAVRPLRDLVPGREAPGFLDEGADAGTLEEAVDALRASPTARIRSGLEHVYAAGRRRVPAWLGDLHRGDAEAWRILGRAQRAAFDTALRPVWPQVQDLHRRELTRHALTTSEHGLGAALQEIAPASRLHDHVWAFDDLPDRDVRLDGRGLVLLPTFHWTGPPLLASLPDRPHVLTYPAGPGVPLSRAAAAAPEEALADVLGRTRLLALLQLADPHTTTGLARRLRVSNATASAHAAALRGAGLVTTTRAGRSVLHQRTALGTLLVRRHDPAGYPYVRS